MASYADSTTPPTRAATPEELRQKTAANQAPSEDELRRQKIAKMLQGQLNMDRKDMEGFSWVHEPLIAREELTLLAGPGGVGKGVWLAYLTACMNGRRRWPDGVQTEPIKVGWVPREESRKKTTIPRLVANNAQTSMVKWLEPNLWDVRYGGAELLAEAIMQAGYSVLIYDPIIYSLAKGSNDDQGTRELLEQYQLAAQLSGAAIIGVHHHAKYAGKRIKEGTPADLIRGSGAIKDVARQVIQIAKDNQAEDQSRIVIVGKSNRKTLPSDEHIRYWAKFEYLGDDAKQRPISAEKVTEAALEGGGWATFDAAMQPKDEGKAGKAAKSKSDQELAEEEFWNWTNDRIQKGKVPYVSVGQAWIAAQHPDLADRTILYGLERSGRMDTRKATKDEVKALGTGAKNANVIVIKNASP